MIDTDAAQTNTNEQQKRHDGDDDDDEQPRKRMKATSEQHGDEDDGRAGGNASTREDQVGDGAAPNGPSTGGSRMDHGGETAGAANADDGNDDGDDDDDDDVIYADMSVPVAAGAAAGQAAAARTQTGQAAAAPTSTAAASVGAGAVPASVPQAAALHKEVLSSVQVGLLRWWTTDAELLALCSEYGTVVDVIFSEDTLNGKSRCETSIATGARRPSSFQSTRLAFQCVADQMCACVCVCVCVCVSRSLSRSLCLILTYRRLFSHPLGRHEPTHPRTQGCGNGVLRQRRRGGEVCGGDARTRDQRTGVHHVRRFQL